MSQKRQLISLFTACIFVFSLALDYDVHQFEGRFYFFDHTRQVSWNKASSICVDDFLQIATANTKAIQGFLKQHIQPNKDYWLGLISFLPFKPGVPSNPMWEIGWYNPINNVFDSDWCRNEPNLNGKAAILSREKCWRFIDLAVPNYIICESPTVEPVDIIHAADGMYNVYLMSGVSFLDAYRICNSDNKSLANIDTELLFNQVNTEMVAKNYGEEYWIGLKNFDQYGLPVSKWHWNSTGHSLALKAWCPPAQPREMRDKYEWCGYQNVNKKCWETETCDRTTHANINGFISKDNEIDDFDDLPDMSGYEVMTYAKKEFYLYTHTPASWYQAYKICLEKKKKLVALSTSQTDEYFKKLAKERSISRIWIGVDSHYESSAKGSKLYWHWNSTKEEISYESWCSHEPLPALSTCGYITTRETTPCWKTTKCAHGGISSFICE